MILNLKIFRKSRSSHSMNGILLWQSFVFSWILCGFFVLTFCHLATFWCCDPMAACCTFCRNHRGWTCYQQLEGPPGRTRAGVVRSHGAQIVSVKSPGPQIVSVWTQVLCVCVYDVPVLYLSNTDDPAIWRAKWASKRSDAATVNQFLQSPVCPGEEMYNISINQKYFFFLHFILQ